MSFHIHKMRMSDTAEQIVAIWHSQCMRWNPVITIATVWAAATMPLVWLRGYNSDEGLAVSIARTALEDGYWLTPHVFNLLWIERPTLLSWIIAGVSVPFGQVSQVTARLPVALFLLLGCLLIYSLLRKLGASVPASVFGTAAFLACPLVQRSYVMPTADMPLAVLLFSAFVLWWGGFATGRISLYRWIFIGAVLTLAGLMKGPEPVGYFALGLGLFILTSRKWTLLPGLVLAGTICALPLGAWYDYVYVSGDEAQWAAFMRFRPAVQLAGPVEEIIRLFFEILPAILIAATFPLARWSKENRIGQSTFTLALACYAFTTPIIILFWPGGSTARYFFPMILPLCVFGGLAYDAVSTQRQLVTAANLLVVTALIIYALTYSLVAAPLLPTKFRRSEIKAARIIRLVQAAPAPIYRTNVAALNVIPYVPGRILSKTLSELKVMQGPAWIIVSATDANILLSQRPTELHFVMPADENGAQLLRLD